MQEEAANDNASHPDSHQTAGSIDSAADDAVVEQETARQVTARRDRETAVDNMDVTDASALLLCTKK